MAKGYIPKIYEDEDIQGILDHSSKSLSQKSFSQFKSDLEYVRSLEDIHPDDLRKVIGYIPGLILSKGLRFSSKKLVKLLFTIFSEEDKVAFLQNWSNEIDLVSTVSSQRNLVNQITTLQDKGLISFSPGEEYV